MGEEAEQSGRRFRRDLRWNVASLAFLAASGIALNALIGLYWDAAALGVFNQVLAAYVFFSQAAAGGINLSLLRALSSSRSQDPAPVLLGALAPTVLLALPVTVLFALAGEPLARLLDSPQVSAGVLAAAPGLFFFALNKVLLGAVNGLRRMRTFAVLQALRYVLVLAGLLVLIWVDAPAERLPFVFTFAEGLLLIVLAVEVSLRIPFWRGRGFGSWGLVHARYGVKSLLSGMLLELNSRVDVLMLGWLLDDTAVGVYSFAALFAEGFFQLSVVLQNNYNPILAEHLATGRLAELEKIVRRGRWGALAGMAAAGLTAILVYPLILELLTNKPEFLASRFPFRTLVVGIALASGYLPFFHVLAMGNRPGWHSVFLLGVVLLNAAGNVLLIPRMGIEGAALATAGSFVLSAFLLRSMARGLLGLRL